MEAVEAKNVVLKDVLPNTPKMPIPNIENAKINKRLNKPFCRNPFETSTFLTNILDLDLRENKKVKKLPFFVIMLHKLLK
ncbi:MAG: hypothetical protein ACRD6X_10170 [Pyrinomonadaceae bacterium]